jgi:hypothetical protein
MRGFAMCSLERRLRRLERMKGMGAKREVVGLTPAEIDEGVAKLRRAGFAGEIETYLIPIEFVSPPPRDEDGNIIGPPPPSVMMWDMEASSP